MAGLSAEQVEFFVQHNFLKLEGAIRRDLCERWVTAGCEASGVDLAVRPHCKHPALPQLDFQGRFQRDCLWLQDMATWGERSVRAEFSAAMSEAAPRLHAAICELCGVRYKHPSPTSAMFLRDCLCLQGAERVTDAVGLTLDAGFVVNYDQAHDQPWAEPLGAHGKPQHRSSPRRNLISRGISERLLAIAGGWHVDGDFNHFLDAPEAGLFYIICWNDIEYQAGAT